MRTTVRLDDDVYRAARRIAEAKGSTLGAVLSELVRRALVDSCGAGHELDLPAFDLREGAPPITPELVQELLEGRD